MPDDLSANGPASRRPVPNLPARASFSGTAFPGWYPVLQATAVATWWIWLAVQPEARATFMPRHATEVELLLFAAPDLLVAVPASLAAGILWLRRSRWAMPVQWLAAGAVLYAFGACVAWSWLRDGAWLNVALMAPAALLMAVAALDASVGHVAIFRRARDATAARHIAATSGQIVVFWSFFLALVPYAIRQVEARVGVPAVTFEGQLPGSVALFVACSALGLWSGITMARQGRGTPLPFDATSQLVCGGPYAYLRNPMVVAGLGQGAAVALGLGSVAVLLYVLLGEWIWQVLVRPAEERDLAAQFGAAYEAYRREVRCWFPRRRGANRAAA